MFETSRDILNLVLSISIAALAFFICLALYYVITVFKKGLGLVKKGEDIVSKIEMVLDLVKSKVNSSASYIFTLGELVKKVSSFIRNRKEERYDEEEEEEYEVKRRPKRAKKS
jgi:hypothetical protein